MTPFGEESQSETLYLVDVSSMFFRAFYAVRELTSPKGIPTNAVFGFLSMILKLLKDEQPRHLVFCFDRPEPSFRKDIFSDYKANRSEMPSELIPQIPIIKSLGPLLGIACYEAQGFEADDIIGTLAVKAVANGYRVLIVSGDKDFSQLVNSKVSLFDTMKGERTDEVAVQVKYGVSPAQFRDYLALTGDASDNIPGVEGIGPKTAQKLISEYGSLENLYEQIEKIPAGKLKEKLSSHKDMAFLSQKLVSIHTAVPMDFSLEDTHLKPPLRGDLNRLLDELGFKTLHKQVDALFNLSETSAQGASLVLTRSPAGGISVPSQPVPVLLKSQWDDFFLDQTEIWTFQISDPSGFFVADAEGQNLRMISEEDLKFFGQFLQLKDKKLLGFGLKNVLHHLGMDPAFGLPVVAWDGELAAYLVKPGENLDIERVISRYIPGETQNAFRQPLMLLQNLIRLKQELFHLLESRGDRHLLEQLDFPLVSILYGMEKKGIGLDVQILARQSESLEKDLRAAEKQIIELAGETFNVASPKQLAVILFEKLQLPPAKKTKSGYSTDADVLEQLKKQHPIIPLLIEYREISKLKSTYVDALPLLLGPDQRLHTTFHQALTTTGRLSSTHPNLQNIPVRSPRGAAIRTAFCASPGTELLSLDYSQVELRILAHISADKNLTRAFLEDQDVHSATAAEVFSVNLEAVTSEQRRIAKAVNFGIAYGQGAFGLAETLGISRGESQKIIQRYFERFPGVKNYIDDTIQLAASQGYVETLFGRRRYIDELSSQNPAIRKFGERAAINARIQGTAADLMKKAMIQVQKNQHVSLLLQIHDELIFEGFPLALDAQLPHLVSDMESVANLNVPLRVSGNRGKNWGSTKG